MVAVKVANDRHRSRSITDPDGRDVAARPISLALGTSDVTVMDRASGYSTLANQGIHDPSAFRWSRIAQQLH